MRLYQTVCVAGLCLAGPSSAQPASQAGALPLSTREYLASAAQSDKFEITEGRIAAAVSTSPAVRDFAQRMVRDHADSTAKLMAAASASEIPTEKPTLSGDQQKTLAKLELKSGSEFDKEYIKQQITAHKVALQITNDYAVGGSNSRIKATAQAIVPVVRGHLAMLQQMASK